MPAARRQVAQRHAAVRVNAILVLADRLGRVRHRYAEERPRGNTLTVLCKRCNSTTGSVYGTEYARFMKDVANHAEGKHHGEQVQFTTRTFPLRIVKQALTTLCATSGDLGREMPIATGS